MRSSNKRINKKTIFIIIGVIVLIGAAGAGAYFYQESKINKLNEDKDGKISQLEKDNADLKKEAAEIKNKTSIGRVGEARSIAYATVVRDIQQAIIASNFNSLVSHMEPTVDVVMAASEAGGKLSPQQAADTMKFLEAANGSWSFEVPEPTVSQWRKGHYASMIPSSDNGVVGMTTDGYILAVTINKLNKITKVFIATENAMNL